MTSNQAIYQDAPGLEPQQDVTAAAHEHGHIDQDDVAPELEAGHVEAAAEDGFAMEDAETYGERLTRVLTGEAEATPRSSAQKDGGSNRAPRAKLALMRRRKADTKRKASKAAWRTGVRERAEELARTADSEKATTARTDPSATSGTSSTQASDVPQRIKMVGDDGKPMRRHGIRERVLHFTPSWFSVTMGTGVIATLLNLLPWPSIHSGLRYPAAVFLLADIVIFIVFVCAFLARYVMFPEVLPLTIKHPQKSMFLGTLPMGLITIVSGIAQLGTVEFGLGMGFALAASGVWWACVVLSLLTSIGVPFSMMTYQKHYFEGITAALLLPIVPPITAAATGSVLAEIFIERYPTYAFTIMVVSYLVLGIGLPLALLIQVLYFQRLLLFNSPPRDVIISVFLPLGPCGQGGYACLHLGRVALQLFPVISVPASSSGVPQLFSVGQALYGAGLISAMMLFGLGMWWLVIGVCTIVRELSHGKLGFNMGWWGLTFPSASLAICTASLAVELDSLALKITYTALVVANISLWTYVAIPTVRGAWTGRLFSAPCLADLPLKP